MKTFTCPKCKQNGISFKDKYRASLWQVIYCNSCGARLCAQPWLLAFAYFIYTWAVVSFVTIAFYRESYMPILYLVITWLLLDFISVMSMPLSVMRPLNRPP